MLALLDLWCDFHDHGITSFDLGDEVNVWGFHSMSVLKCDYIGDAYLTRHGDMVRQHNGQPTKNPCVTIYEVMMYCVMTAPKKCT